MKCLVCDKEFDGNPSRKVRYCSQKCQWLASSRRRHGFPINGPLKFSPKGKGGLKYGYRVLTMKHPNSSKRGKIMEHVFVMSNHVGRPLFPRETVHHKNGIRDDNRIENLELWSSEHPPGQRVEDKIKWCKEFLNQYDKK